MEIDGKVESLRISGGAVLVTVWGITLNEWVAIITIFYLALQIIILFPKMISTLKSLRKKLPGAK
jgi:hypothetical protein